MNNNDVVLHKKTHYDKIVTVFVLHTVTVSGVRIFYTIYFLI